jgi:acetyl esterase
MTRDESIALLDPELMAYLERPSEDLASVPLAVARINANAALRAMARPPERLPQVVTLAGLNDDPSLEVRVHFPSKITPKCAVLHVHGGGMVKGSAAALDGRIYDLSQRLDAIIVSVEYRKAPETPFPGSLHDCVAAWNWMTEQRVEWGLPLTACFISGDSSGGGLAAATTLYLRDTGGIMPARQVLVYPMLDYLTGIGPDVHLDTRLGWTSSNNQFGWRALLGEKGVPTGQALGHFSPAHAQSFVGLPPTWIGVGTLDLFLGENALFALQLATAGCDVTLCTYKGAPHGFQVIKSRVSERFFKDYVAAFSPILS